MMRDTVRGSLYPKKAARVLCALLAAGLLVLGACLPKSGTGARKGETRVITLYGFSVMKEVMDKAVLPAFIEKWKREQGEDVRFIASYAGSETITNQILQGVAADIGIFSIERDVHRLIEKGMVKPDWKTGLPASGIINKTPFIILVRKGNPKGIRDWPDLARPDVAVITPNPKTSGGARWNYLAAWGYALRQPGGSPDTARALVAAIFRNVPVLDSGARGATNTFVQRGLGDVLLSWENEAHLVAGELGAGRFEIVVPSVSILAEPPVALVDAVAGARGPRGLARAYLEFLFTPEAQDIAARHHYRPRVPESAAKHAARFPPAPIFTVDEAFGGWEKAHREHFADGAEFDRIYGDGAGAR